MSLTIKNSVISKTNDCLRKEILTYVSYPSSSSRCFAWPQFIVSGTTFTPLSTSAFPDNGSFSLAVSGGKSVFDLKCDFGNLVVMTLNMDFDDEFQSNTYYDPNTIFGDCQLHSVTDPNKLKGRSLVEFAKFSSHKLSNQLMQVMEAEEYIDFESVRDCALTTRFNGQAPSPLTKYILISQVENGVPTLFGPFEYSELPDDQYSIGAASEYSHRISLLPESLFEDGLEVVNNMSEVYAKFVGSEDVAAAIPNHPNYDWFSDEGLIDYIGRIAARSENVSLTKKEIRELKTALVEISTSDDFIDLDVARLARIQGMLNRYEDWAELPESIKADQVAAIPLNQLAEYVLSDENFSDFANRVMEHERVKEVVLATRAKIEQSLDQFKASVIVERNSLEKQIKACQAELKELEADISRARLESEQVASEALTAKREEYNQLVAQVEGKKTELSAVNAGLEEASSRRGDLEAELDSVISDMADEVKVAGKLMESTLLHQLVSGLSGVEPRAAKPRNDALANDTTNPVHAPSLILVPEEDDLDHDDVVDLIYAGITDFGGRECTKNEVINYLICMLQGYITTFAGLPGTGKTSLVNLIAGALGLANIESKRYVEVPVERGWTSHTDFIGYYNPLSRQIEKSNAEVFDAFSQMNAEVELGLADTPPFLVLLDEANLSSLEHYWAPFLRVCDSFHRGPANLSIGNSTIKVPEYLRFMATVNFDHTTEELSPRFLDRSWVITLDPAAMDFDSDFNPSEVSFDQNEAFSYRKLKSVFGPCSDGAIDSTMRDLYGKVLSICQENNFAISPRSQIMMRNYMNVASKLMSKSSKDEMMAPLDYALSQKVLPTISGPAERLERLISTLQGELTALPITSSRLKRINDIGSSSGFYQYFA